MYDSRPQLATAGVLMKIRWAMVGFIATLSVAVFALAAQYHVFAGAPQNAMTMAPAAKPASGMSAVAPAGGFSIPDTTSAINSDKPMSQRVVHYEIDAKYDAAKHTVDATEVLTYHNLTGQALDHFPFHLYQNAFQPNSTWVREAKVSGTRDVGYEKWESKLYGSEEIKSLEVVGQGDLTSQLQYIQ